MQSVGTRRCAARSPSRAALRSTSARVPRRGCRSISTSTSSAAPIASGMVQERPAIESALVGLVVRLGYHVQQSAEAAASRKIYATYRSVLGPSDRIELDVNYLWRVPLAGLRRAELWQPGELDRPPITVVSDEELWVGKLLAFLDRTAPRDAWDISRMPSIAPELLQSPLLRRWFVAMSFILDHPLATYDQNRLRARLTADAIEAQLHPTLTRDDRPDPATLFGTRVGRRRASDVAERRRVELRRTGAASRPPRRAALQRRSRDGRAVRDPSAGCLEALESPQASWPRVSSPIAHRLCRPGDGLRAARNRDASL